MEDTIAAISTAPGEGGIGIIRISGTESLQILNRIFQPAGKVEIKPRRMTYGHIVDPDTNKEIDEVLSVFMPAPKTYTTEDVVEINCHGGMVPVREILLLTLRQGARLAEPGEFTKRAFLNGRLDLSQAEAVMDLISAKSDKSYELALNQLEGSLSQEISNLRSKLMDILVNLTVNIDYPDEDIEIVTYENMKEELKPIQEEMEQVLAGANTGKIIRDGLRTAIIGKPNVGKSSLMNKILRESRAIVTDIPGTTRDTIEETCTISGIPIILTDTAGIRETEDTIESIGIERSRQSAEQADLVLFVLDSSREMDEEDLEIIQTVKDKKPVVILNKTDLPGKISEEDVLREIPQAEILKASMKEGVGLREIEDAVTRRVYQGEVKPGQSVLLTNARHQDSLERALRQIKNAQDLIVRQEPFEIIELTVQDAYECLGEVVGESVSEDIIQEVFSRFCLGK